MANNLTIQTLGRNKMPPQGPPYQCPFRYSHDSPTSITYINCTQETKLSWQLPSSACSSALNLHATRPFAKEFTLHGSRLFLIGHGTDIWGPAVTWLSACRASGMYAVVPCLYEADRLFSWSLGWDTKLEGWDAKKVYIYMYRLGVLEFDKKKIRYPIHLVRIHLISSLQDEVRNCTPRRRGDRLCPLDLAGTLDRHRRQSWNLCANCQGQQPRH
jgi:hypothetical protein